ncbi:SPFH domain-containing protein [bacterium]|nr:SPFH domain-containing protein [bacterium]RQV98953.1 MAG: SPFH domain-containing protein [bacterium]
MGMKNMVFLEVIEWFDRTGNEIVHRIPEEGSGEIKFGARLIVRESQAAVFFYQGKAYDAFGPGNHHLSTANIPVLNKIMSIPWGMTSPLRAEVYFVNLKLFPNLKWGTRNPVAFKDTQLGLIRLRAFGIFNIRVVQPILFINHLVGTQHMFTTSDIEEFLSRVIVSRFNDHLGENLDSILNMPGKYDKLSDGLQKRLQNDFSRLGLSLSDLYISSITPPPEVQKAIDDKSRLAVFDDLNKLLKMKAAMAVEKVAEQQGEAGAGAGLGLGLMIPAAFSQFMHADRDTGSNESVKCPDCQNNIPASSRFCPHCGHQVVIFQTCSHCGKNLPPHAKFCSRCGQKIENKTTLKKCSHCGAKNLNESIYCNKCGEKL